MDVEFYTTVEFLNLNSFEKHSRLPKKGNREEYSHIDV